MISLVIGGLCTVIMVKNVNAIGGKKVNMVIINQHVLPGKELTSSDITTAEMPSNYAKNAVLDPNDAIGKKIAYELIPGEPLLKNMISTKPMRDGLYQNEVGVRVQVDAVTYGGAEPGDYVDVLVQVPHGTGQPSTISTLYNHIRVVAEFNSQGQSVTKATQQSAGSPSLTMGGNGSTIPAYVELAVTTSQRDQLLSAGKVVLSVNPWENGNTPQPMQSIPITPPSNQSIATPPQTPPNDNSNGQNTQTNQTNLPPSSNTPNNVSETQQTTK